jgi:hypothetical protein
MKPAGCGGMNRAAETSSNSELRAVSPRCPGRCLSPCRIVTAGTPGYALAIPLGVRLNLRVKTTTHRAEPKLPAGEGRGPPPTANPA